MSNDVPQIPRGHEPVGPRAARALPIIRRAVSKRLAEMYEGTLTDAHFTRRRFSEENP